MLKVVCIISIICIGILLILYIKYKQSIHSNFTSSKFEQKLIKECREDGMSDEDIAQWLKEI